jgi:hypothetical protein
MSRRSRRQPPSLPEQVQGRAMPAISLILFGLIVGLGGALYYAWIISPVTFTEASPAGLRSGSVAAGDRSPGG